MRTQQDKENINNVCKESVEKGNEDLGEELKIRCVSLAKYPSEMGSTSRQSDRREITENI